MLAAGCLMPGFAEAAPVLETWPDYNEKSNWDLEHTPNEYTVTIKGVTNDGLEFGDIISINWLGDNEESVEGCKINVNYDNSNDHLTITPKIGICGGYVANGDAISNTVNISNVKFKNRADIFGGCSGNPYSSAAAIFSGDTSGDVTKNEVKISGNTKFEKFYYIYGGKSSSGNANENRVSISGGTFGESLYSGLIFGGRSDSGEANYNKVIISGGTITGSVFGGYSESGEANKNSVIISGGTINGSVCGGHAFGSSSEANKNKVILVGNEATYKFIDTQGTEQTLTGSGINITGFVYGYYTTYTNSTRSGNAIHVYGSNTKVGGIANYDNLNFYINHKMTYGDIMLKITGEGVTDISESNVSVNVDGAPQAKGDLNTITLIQKTDEDTGSIIKAENTNITVNFGPALTGTGTVALTEDQKDLVLTLNVEKTTVNENGKSLVETRAAAAFVVNNMSDFMLGTGMEQAKAAAGGVTPIDAGTMAPFAAVGGSNMRYTTGSYVDVNGWNGAVGFAKQADKLLFGVAVEHGRGNYDSYLDNGVHASGDIKSTGGVIFGEYKLDNGVHYDAALRAGRVKSDYSSTATSYDESSAYYGFSLGGGKEVTVSDKATLDVYGRYYFSHTNGSDVAIATGEEIDFDAVNSHRLRIGGRYTTTLTEKSKAYAGLAWQYEFGGDAKAAINGYSAPTPSLQGHSAIVEAGYKLNAGKNLTLDFNLNGAMGKQRGIGGGIAAQWMF